MKTIKDLKKYLQAFLDTLENYDDQQELSIHNNTYFCGGEFLATYDGFIDLNWPVDEEDEEEDE